MSDKAVKKMRRMIRRRLEAEKELLNVKDAVKPLLSAIQKLKPKVEGCGVCVFLKKDVDGFYKEVNAWISQSSTQSKS